MKLPSLNTLLSGAGAALRRFPLAIASALIAAAGAVWLIQKEDLGHTDLTVPSNLFLVGMLGISLFIGIRIFVEHRAWPPARRTILELAGLAGLLLYYVLLPTNVFQGYEHYLVTYALLVVASHFAVAVAPYAGPPTLQRFWDFNKSVFLRFLAGGLYSGVLFAGLSVALLALDKLLGVEIHGRTYGQLFAVIGLGFNTWYFVSTIPAIPSPDDAPYPRALKTFSQYILVPLVAIYVLILYAYTVKILGAWEWPEGWVANLVLGFSVTGILALLFVYPIRDREENRWIRTIWRWYFPALFPLTILLLLAIWRRVSEYGITPNRYVVIVMGLWLCGLVVFYSVRKSGNIAVIPLSFLALTLLTAVGPWGALPVSERSQRGRLEEILLRHGILQDGAIVRTAASIPPGDAGEISSIVQYLTAMHGPEVLRPWFGSRLDSLIADSTAGRERDGAKSVAPAIVRAMGVPYTTQWGRRQASYFFRSAGGRSVSIAGYHRLYAPGQLSRETPAAADSTGELRVRLDPDRATLTLESFHASAAPDSVVFSLRSWLDTALDAEPAAPFIMPARVMTAEASCPSMDVRLLLNQFSGRLETDSLRVESVTPEFLLRFHPDRASGAP